MLRALHSGEFAWSRGLSRSCARGRARAQASGRKSEAPWLLSRTMFLSRWRPLIRGGGEGSKASLASVCRANARARSTTTTTRDKEGGRENKNRQQHRGSGRAPLPPASEEDNFSSRYDKIARRRSGHLKKNRVDTYDLLESDKRASSSASSFAAKKGKGKGLQGKEKLSNRALFRQTPVDANVMSRIQSLQLCQENRRAQRIAKSKVRDFKKNVSSTHKVSVSSETPVQLERGRRVSHEREESKSESAHPILWVQT